MAKFKVFCIFLKKLSWIFAWNEIGWKWLVSSFICNSVTFACLAKLRVRYCLSRPNCSILWWAISLELIYPFADIHLSSFTNVRIWTKIEFSNVAKCWWRSRGAVSSPTGSWQSRDECSGGKVRARGASRLFDGYWK